MSKMKNYNSMKIGNSLAYLGYFFNRINSYPTQEKEYNKIQQKLINDLWQKETSHAYHCLNRVNFIHKTEDWLKVENFAQQVRNKKLVGISGKKIKNIIHIGIGGSYLGSKFLYEAYQDSALTTIKSYFISNLSGIEISSLLNQIKPEETLIIIVSKSFGTQEVFQLANICLKWFEQILQKDRKQIITHHFVGISSQSDKMTKWGIDPNKQFSIPEKQGGRYSMSSAVSLMNYIVQKKEFEEFMQGAHDFDLLLKDADYSQNIAFHLAQGQWLKMQQGISNLVILPYTKRWEKLDVFLAQLIMESLGKNKIINNNTSLISPVVWGGSGTESQHSFFQMLHQDEHKLVIHLHLPKKLTHSNLPQFLKTDFEQTEKLMHYNALAQIEALAKGNSEQYDSQNIIKGNHCLFNWLPQSDSAYDLGQLISLYEHFVYYYAQFAQINPYNQPGVEFSKQVCNKMYNDQWDWSKESLELKNYLEDNDEQL